ncbi:MAG TPA: glycosyltransferase [Pyrinomonadaceae bacterium]|nr:glycosyltransferase [Pyrinomonadaceae bacterium]
MSKKIASVFRIVSSQGVAGLRRKIYWKFARFFDDRQYQTWLRRFGTLDASHVSVMQQEIADWHNKPLISIVLPVYNVDEKWLSRCIDSVLRQIYSKWELCIADDCSTAEHIRPILNEYAARDDRINIVFRPENGHISAASNSALEMVTGEFTVLLDHDDQLSGDALFWVAKELNDHPETKMIYSDEDMIGADGRRYGPKFKPDFSRDLFYSLNLITHLSGYKTEVLRRIDGFRPGVEGSQDYDLALRVIETISENEIRHIPRILYHWRAIEGSVALSSDEKPYAHERAREAIRDHLTRIGKNAEVTPSRFNLHRVLYKLPDPLPRVSLIIDASKLAGDEAAMLESLVDRTEYPEIEKILVSEKEGVSDNARTIVLQTSGIAAGLNAAAESATGEVLCFVRLGFTPINSDWLRECVSFALQDEIGAVGGELLAADETVIGGGLVIGAGGLVGCAHREFPHDFAGNMARNIVTGNFSAVSAWCMVIRKSLFVDIGGFDSTVLPEQLFDADLCLRLCESGYRIVFTPYAKLIELTESRAEARKAPSKSEADYFVSRWKEYVEQDPFYNPNLSKKDASFSIDI